MTRRWIAALAVLLALGLVGGWLSADGGARLPSALSANLAGDRSHWTPVGVIYLDESGAMQFVIELPETATPTAPPTNTPRPTATPTNPPTITRTVSTTPTASSTPDYIRTPTQTPTARASASAEPSPTAELTPQPTVGPQPTPIPPDLVCYGSAVYGLNVRSGPGVEFGKLGSLAAGAGFRITGVTLSGGDEWAAIQTAAGIAGWVASYFGGVEFVTWGDSDECMIIRWGEGTPALLSGPHLLLNANVGALAGYLARAGVVKEVSGNGAILAAARAVNPDVITVYRTTAFGECPPDDYTGAQWIDLLIQVWPVGADWYEPMNECAEFAPGYSNTFNLDMVKRANQRGYCLLLYSFGVGWPSESFFAATRPVWDYVLMHPCQVGRHHALGLHAYGLGYERESTWLFSRWRRLCAGDMMQTCQRIGLWFTEWEHYDKESDPVDCARVVENIRWARANYKGTPIRGIMLWSFGGWGGVWRDLTSCAAVLAG